jgi:hypothetical protein
MRSTVICIYPFLLYNPRINALWVYRQSGKPLSLCLSVLPKGKNRAPLRHSCRIEKTDAEESLKTRAGQKDLFIYSLFCDYKLTHHGLASVHHGRNIL